MSNPWHEPSFTPLIFVRAGSKGSGETVHCTVSPEPLLPTYSISTKISRTGSINSLNMSYMYIISYYAMYIQVIFELLYSCYFQTEVEMSCARKW